jgi:hypothetical protein
MEATKDAKQTKLKKSFDIKPRALPVGFERDTLFIEVDYTQKFLEYEVPAPLVAVFCSEMYLYGYKLNRLTLYNPVRKAWYILFERKNDVMTDDRNNSKAKRKSSSKK